MEFRLIEDKELKSQITSDVLLDLPEWFGLPESTKEYIEDVKELKFIAVYDNDYIGFCALKEESPEHINMHVLGIKKAYHRKGIGSKMFQFIEEYVKDFNYKYISVLTLSPEGNSKEYDHTREYYLKVGFKVFMDLPTLWDENNPAVLLVKEL